MDKFPSSLLPWINEISIVTHIYFLPSGCPCCRAEFLTSDCTLFHTKNVIGSPASNSLQIQQHKSKSAKSYFRKNLSGLSHKPHRSHRPSLHNGIGLLLPISCARNKLTDIFLNKLIGPSIWDIKYAFSLSSAPISCYNCHATAIYDKKKVIEHRYTGSTAHTFGSTQSNRKQITSKRMTTNEITSCHHVKCSEKSLSTFATPIPAHLIGSFLLRLFTKMLG